MATKKTPAGIPKRGVRVKFKTGRASTIIKGVVRGSVFGPHGSWATVKCDDGVTRSVRPGSLKVI